MQGKCSLFLALTAAFVWTTALADPDAAAHAKSVVVKENAAGGVSAGKFSAGRGPNGGAYARAGKTTRSADGTVNHQSGFGASGSRGQVQSRGSFNKSADGNASGERTTTATGASGNTYHGDTTYAKGQGVDHTATCTDAAGNVIPCKR